MPNKKIEHNGALLPRNMELVLKNLYYDPKSPASFSSMIRLYREAKKSLPTISQRQVQNFLNSQKTYTMYRQNIQRYKKLKTISSGLNSDWQADLMDMQKHAKNNKWHNYILVCIDVLSRMVYAKAIKRKTSDNVIEAFKAIFKEANAVPSRLFTDNGKEFTANALKKFYDDEEIIKLFAVTNTVLHATMAERTIRTLRDILAKYFAENKTFKWIDVLPKIVHSLNHRIQSTTKMRPADVNYKNAEKLRSKLYDHQHVFKKKPKYKVGDLVRVSAKKILFRKSPHRYSPKIFRISKVIRRNPPVYNISAVNGEFHVSGYFYEQELVPAINQT